MSAVRTRVRDAVLARLKVLEGSSSAGAVRTVRAYAGELGGEDADDLMATLNGIAPAILVAVEKGAFRSIQVQRRKYRRDLAVVLYLVSVLQSKPEARDEQIAEIEDAVLALLTGLKLELAGDVVPHGVLEPVAEDVMVHDATVCIWRQHWMVTVEAELAAAPAPNVVEVLGGLNAPSEEDNAGDPIVQVSTLITT